MDLFIPTKEELDDAVYKAVKRVMREELPEIIRKATRKKWLRTDEVMEILQCSRRHVQYLRDSNQIEFYQHARTIRYTREAVEDFLNRVKIERIE